MLQWPVGSKAEAEALNILLSPVSHKLLFLWLISSAGYVAASPTSSFCRWFNPRGVLCHPRSLSLLLLLCSHDRQLPWSASWFAGDGSIGTFPTKRIQVLNFALLCFRSEDHWWISGSTNISMISDFTVFWNVTLSLRICPILKVQNKYLLCSEQQSIFYNAFYTF